MKLLLLIPLLCGCSVIKELKRPPFPYVVLHHTRAIGVEANVPNQAGDSVLKFRLGFFSDSWSLIPCCTNSQGQMSIPTISDSFKFGQVISLTPDTTVSEVLDTGWSGQPPAARYSNFFTKP